MPAHRLVSHAVLAAVLGLAAPWPALAQSPQTVLAQSTQTVLAQVQREYRSVDGELNASYQALMRQLDEGARPHLVKAQLAWIAFRDAERAFEEDLYREGTHRPVAGYEALVRLTRQRTHEFNAAGEEIDLALDHGFPDMKVVLADLEAQEAAHRQADVRLNKVYQALKARGDAANRKLLIRAQIKWIAFRDAEGDFKGTMLHKSPVGPLWNATSLLTTTTVRADDLETLGRGLGSRR